MPDGGDAVSGGSQALQTSEIQKNIATAATAEPKEGSVVQSSNVESGITADSVEVGVTYNSESEQWAYRATKTAGMGGGIGATISSTSDEVLDRGNTPSNKFVELYKKLPHGRLWVDIYTDNTPVIGSAPSGIVDVPIGSMVLSGGISIRSGGSSRLGGNFNGQVGTLSCPVGCSIVGGITTAGAWTFTPDSGGSAGSVVVVTQDTDYLAGGLWVYVPDNASSLADYEYGVFVDGNDKFMQANLAGLTGTAEYVGDDGVTGVFADESTGENTFFNADVRLTANFGNDSVAGTISGVINNVMDGNSPIAGNPVLMLNVAMPDTGSSLFTGDTSMTFKEETYAGKWGGQFYGNGDTATDHPGSVAGTFGASIENGERSLLGVFGAYKDEE